jgi:hypothetical protein
MGDNNHPPSVRDVGCDDGRHDGAIGGTDAFSLSHCQPTPIDDRPTAGPGKHFSPWLPRGLDRVLRSGHPGPVVATQDRTPITHNGHYQSGFERRIAPRSRRFPMDSTQARVLKGLSVSPLSFLMSEWRDGAAGAFVMGLRHGSYCLGCCWMLMALLFVVGVMNLFWVVMIALFVMAEKMLVRGELLGHVTGIVLGTAGVVLVVRLW